MDLQDFFIDKNTAVLLLSPPSSGKTTSVKEMYAKGDFSLVFLSPLKALAIEFFNRMKDEKNVLFANLVKELKDEEFKILFGKKFLLVGTVESVSGKIIDFILEKDQKVIFIFDEFHLFYAWGRDFRPILWESLLKVAGEGKPILGMTATFNKKNLEEWRRDFLLNYKTSYLINLGNQKLKKRPSRCFYFISKKSLMKRLLKESKKKERILVFCQYRYEVDKLVEFFEKKKKVVVGCVGGQVEEFKDKMEKIDNKPDIIVATTVLSHGVNLPSISKIFFTYKVRDLDFWIQMTGRGGRNGESFSIYTFDRYKEHSRGTFFFRVLLSWLGSF